MAPRLIIGFDPGLTTGGMVLMSYPPERIIAARSLVRAIPKIDVPIGERAFTAAEAHARDVAQRAALTLDEWIAEHGPVAAIGIEAFIDQPSRARKPNLVKDRWKTPLAIGHISARFAERGFASEHGNVFYQDPAILRHFASELAELARPSSGETRTMHDSVCEGDHLLTNDHLRKAWAHGAWLCPRLERTPN